MENLNETAAQPTVEQIATIGTRFWLLLETVKPERILICSQRLWEKWMWPIDNDSRSVRLPTRLNVNGKSSNLWKYDYGTGICISIGIHHPSSLGFSYNEWSPLVKSFLEIDLD